MEKKYSELVIKAPFLLAKGFLLGFIQGRGERFTYFFHRKVGIKRETLSDAIKEIFHLDCYTHLCLPNSIIPEFIAALKNEEKIIDATLESMKEIKSAHFNFSYHIYDESMAGACKELFKHAPIGVLLEDCKPVEQRSPGIVDVSHHSAFSNYAYEGCGKAVGDFEGIMNLYLQIKRHTLRDTILCSEIKLLF